MADYRRFSIEDVDTACNLYDGGWRAGDKAQLIEDYGITEEEADTFCEILAELENDAKEDE
jgi:hypothetical protein